MPGDSALRQVRRDLDMIDWPTAMGEVRSHPWSGWPRGHCTRLWLAAPAGSGTKSSPASRGPEGNTEAGRKTSAAHHQECLAFVTGRLMSGLCLPGTLAHDCCVETVPKYHVVVQPLDSQSRRWGWEIYRDGQPLPVRLRGSNHSKQGAEGAGAKAFREFLAGLSREQGA
jgi:hypothetical protein